MDIVRFLVERGQLQAQMATVALEQTQDANCQVRVSVRFRVSSEVSLLHIFCAKLCFKRSVDRPTRYVTYLGHHPDSTGCVVENKNFRCMCTLHSIV